jgi:hypothetical protein
MAIQDVISELNRIQAAGIISSYAVGGGIGMQEYIEVSFTDDIDVFVVVAGAASGPLVSIGPIWADLVAHGAQEDHLYLVIGGWKMQVLTASTPLQNEAVLHARPKDFGGHIGRIMGPEHLAAIALNTGRVKDYIRIVELIGRGRLDMDVFVQLIDRYGLQSRWDTFQKRYLAPNV